MTHCNGRHCVQTSRYNTDARACHCTCDGCTAETSSGGADPRDDVASSERPRRVTPAAISTRTGILIAVALIGTYVVASTVMNTKRGVASSGSSPVTTEASPTAAETVTPPTPAGYHAVSPRAPTPADLATTVADVKGSMSDVNDGKISPGASILVSRLMERIPYWTEMMALPATTEKLVLKDASSERGKRVCVSGTIAEISITDLGSGSRIGEGGIITDGGTVVRFAAIGSTGSIVHDSYARFCGIAIGRYSFTNTQHTTTHAVYVVGLFDLPENHLVAPKAATPNAVTATTTNHPPKVNGKPRCHPCDEGHCPDPRDAPDCEW